MLVLLDWVVDVQERRVAVPVITNEVPEEVEEEHIGGKYWQRVRKLAGDEGEKRGELKGSYWTREQDELMSENDDNDDNDNDNYNEHDSESPVSEGSEGGGEDDEQDSGDNETED